MMVAILTAVLVGINVLQLPAVDNAKYTIVVQNGQIVRMNTREGTFERCDAELKCVEVAQDK
jgi:hypothetical protein